MDFLLLARSAKLRKLSVIGKMDFEGLSGTKN
jgi:hypothetical protein